MNHTAAVIVTLHWTFPHACRASIRLINHVSQNVDHIIKIDLTQMIVI